jgi:OPA family glycerol-3-phosphate transporter-like MFS transporter
VLLATSISYLVYYTGRQNLGWAIPGLRADLGLSATEIGWVSGVGLVAYGAGQLLSGHLADRMGGRRLVALGAVASCVCNWLTSFGVGFWTLALPWALNGCAQSMGFAPASRLIAAWWPPRARGRAFGVFNFAAGFSSVLTFAAAALVLAWLPWRWVFRLPVILLLGGAVVILALARDRPEEQGMAGHGSVDPLRGSARPEPESLLGRLRWAFGNRAFLLASVGFGFGNWARLGLLVWVPAHVVAAGAGSRAVWITLALPVGMALGALIAGDVADRWLDGNHPRLIVAAYVLATVVSLALLAAPADGRGLALLFLAGFLVFGPFSSFTALAAELLGPRSVGAGVGFMNGVGYGAAALGDVVTGAVIDATGATRAVFAVSAGACLLGALATSLVPSAVRTRPSGRGGLS